MFGTARGRILAVALLLAVQFGLAPLYAHQPVNREAGVYPTEEVFLSSSDHYLGVRVETSGFVRETSPLVVEVATSDGPHRVVVDDAPSADVGDKIRMFGTLTGPHRIRLVRGFVVPRNGLWYTRTVSFLAGLWVLARLIRHWTVDLTTLGFRRRETPLSPPVGVFDSRGER